MAAVGDPWKNVVDRDIIRLVASHFFVAVPALTGSWFSCYGA